MSRAAKMEEWTRRLARFQVSGETITQFCRNEGVSQPSFFAWRKKLGHRSVPAPGSLPRFLPVQIQVPNGSSYRRESVVYLGREVRIEFGSDLALVTAIVNQLVRSLVDSPQAEPERC